MANSGYSGYGNPKKRIKKHARRNSQGGGGLSKISRPRDSRPGPIRGEGRSRLPLRPASAPNRPLVTRPEDFYGFSHPNDPDIGGVPFNPPGGGGNAPFNPIVPYNPPNPPPNPPIPDDNLPRTNIPRMPQVPNPLQIPGSPELNNLASILIPLLMSGGGQKNLGGMGGKT